MRSAVAVLLVSALFWPAAVLGAGGGVLSRAEWFGYQWGAVSRHTPPPPRPEVSEAPQVLLPGDPGWDDDDVATIDEVGLDAELSAGPSASVPPARRTSAAQRGASTRQRAAVKSGGVGAEPKARRPEKGLRVSAATVLRLANARVIPQGAYQAPQGGQPAGMRLAGVSALGVGLRDGDLLSDVAGTPATSRSAVVSAVLAARARQARAVSATFWREGEPWRLVVEMPYLRRPAAPAGGSGASAQRTLPPHQPRDARLSPN